MGHLKTFFAQGVENLISQISKSSNSRGRPGGGGDGEVSNWSIHYLYFILQDVPHTNINTTKPVNHYTILHNSHHRQGLTAEIQALKYLLQGRLTKCPMTLSLGRTYV